MTKCPGVSTVATRSDLMNCLVHISLDCNHFLVFLVYAVFYVKFVSLSSAAGSATTFLATRSKKMSGLFGSVGEFKEGEEDWPQYAERVQHYFTANGVAEGKKVPVFLSLIGAKEYKLVSSLVAPSKPAIRRMGSWYKS